jgi:hypothetical protein
LNYHTAIDRIFSDTSNIGKYYLYRLINGVSNNDGQLLITNNVQKEETNFILTSKGKIKKYNVADFELNLRHETWEAVLMGVMLISF